MVPIHPRITPNLSNFRKLIVTWGALPGNTKSSPTLGFDTLTRLAPIQVEIDFTPTTAQHWRLLVS